MTTTSPLWLPQCPDRWAGRSELRHGCSSRSSSGDVLDRVDQFDDFDPRQHYKLTVSDGELNDVERNAAATSADDIEL